MESKRCTVREGNKRGKGGKERVGSAPGLTAPRQSRRSHCSHACPLPPNPAPTSPPSTPSRYVLVHYAYLYSSVRKPYQVPQGEGSLLRPFPCRTQERPLVVLQLLHTVIIRYGSPSNFNHLLLLSQAQTDHRRSGYLPFPV